MIRLKNISKFYKDNDNNITTGLKRVSMEFEKGEFVVIAGESGSGKSTLLNIISGMLPYEEGELYFCEKETSYYGKEEWEAYRRNYISVVYQDYNLIDSYTVLQNVETALLIAGTSKEEAEEKARKYIDKVGLTAQIKHRASNLSSGQKQRLSIARALAKETDVIVADEPTGNLDEENGRQICAIFKELAEDHLVIMVTHNYDQVKDLATRKIRLYNNELAEDELLKPKYDIEDKVTKIDPDEGLDKKAKEKKKRETVNRFVLINKKAQPKRNLLMFSVYVALMFAMFVFVGTVITNSDDATSKVYDSDNMSNADKTRMIVVREDGKMMTDEDIKTILNISHVKYVDKYDYVGDYNYYYNEDEDYIIRYNKKLSETDTPATTTVKLVEEDKFMKSVTCLTEADIIEGKIATGRYEVVVPKKDAKLLGETVTFYFECSERLKGDAIIGMPMKVVGVTDLEVNQCFFSEKFCSNLSVDFIAPNTKIYTIGAADYGNGVLPIESYDALSEDEKNDYEDALAELAETNSTKYTNPNLHAYRQYQSVFIINEELEGYDIIMAPSFYARNYYLAIDDSVIQQYAYNDAAFVYKYVDENGENQLKTLTLRLKNDMNTSSSQIIEVSEQFFDEVYPDRNLSQVCIYIEDYAYTDDVMSALTAKGYNNFSVFRVGAKEYDEDTVYAKLQIICISLAASVGIFLIGIFIIHTMMKLKKKDFIVYDCLGMDNRVRYNIIKTDLLLNSIVACTVVLAIVFILNMREIEIISNIVKYYRWYTYIVIYVIAIAMANLTSRIFNKYLGKVIK